MHQSDAAAHASAAVRRIAATTGTREVHDRYRHGIVAGHGIARARGIALANTIVAPHAGRRSNGFASMYAMATFHAIASAKAMAESHEVAATKAAPQSMASSHPRERRNHME